ncbi:hypothetical protein W822_17240 [Advenella kashmirensis W13003]|uniref:Uncharacterized protein n=1 Tax=Advenella kashmirensis W13003 TaxID=1424334 RepID=V8QP05_9BURK|nr:hypothetical protein W822_17240 [Advenella kashmirensis W13003]
MLRFSRADPVQQSTALNEDCVLCTQAHRLLPDMLAHASLNVLLKTNIFTTDVGV